MDSELAREARLLDWIQHFLDWGPGLHDARVEALLERRPEAAEEIRSAWERFSRKSGLQDEELPRQLGEYKLLECIGRGATSRVYRAVAPWNAEVALKVLHQAGIANAATVSRFRREVRTAAALEHPSLAPIYDHGTIGAPPTYFLAMPLAREGSLADRLLRKGPLSEDEARSVLFQILLGLKALHESGLIHRDVKPENILCYGMGVVRLSDFGLARSALGDDTVVTLAGEVTGTRAFAAPEQLAGHASIDIRADLYALGKTIDHALGASHAFPSQVTPAFRELLNHLQAEDPTARPKDPGAAIAALGQPLPFVNPPPPASLLPLARKPFYLRPEPVRPLFRTSEGEAAVHPCFHRVAIRRRDQSRSIDLHTGARLIAGRQLGREAPQELKLPLSPPGDPDKDPRSISRHHLQFEIRDGKVYCQDLGSTRGTSVEGQRLEAHAPFELETRTELRLADWQHITCRVQPSPSGGAPALLLWDAKIGESHAIALVPSTLWLTDEFALEVRGLSLCVRHLGKEIAEPLHPDQPVRFDDYELLLLKTVAA